MDRDLAGPLVVEGHRIGVEPGSGLPDVLVAPSFLVVVPAALVAVVVARGRAV
ncbi:MAG: hypothetical protein E7J90_08895 [Cutibacterium avidum]|nr:hypothetical protein [Cutibacterium avidum]